MMCNSINSSLKMIKYLFALSLFVILYGCAALAQPLKEKAANSIAYHIDSAAAGVAYPCAAAADQNLANDPPQVDLSQYQSVQSPIGRPHQRPDIAIAVAASGGGYRAANLTAGVLMGMEQITDPHLKGNLLDEVDYFSTVSGGGLGVGYYMASLYNYLHTYGNSPFNPEFSFVNTIKSMPVNNPLDHDYSADLFAGKNNGALTENDLSQAVLQKANGGTLTLGDIFVPRTGSPADVKLPYWIMNATVYQNAAVFPFTPDVLAAYRVRSYPYRMATHTIAGNVNDKRYAYDVPAAVGLLASASYPMALPPVTLGSDGCLHNPCYLQLFDGGLADNLGIYSALDLLAQDKSKIKILIVIDAYKATLQPYSSLEKPPSMGKLFWRLLTMSSDGARENVKQHLNVIAKDVLCRNGATHVIVIYLDLTRYEKARSIETSLSITPVEQKILLNVGQDLVLKNGQFDQLKKYLDGDVAIGECPR